MTLKAQEFAQYLEFLGPPPNKSVDAFRLGWIGDYVDAMNFLEQWTCDSGNNNTNYCDKSYDQLVDQARKTPDNAKRYELYGQLEEKLLGQNGDRADHPDLLVHVHRSSRRSPSRTRTT